MTEVSNSPWHSWPDDKPPCDGRYLVVMQDRNTDTRKFAIRVFRDNDWIFSVKTEIDYWMEIPKPPIPL